VRSAFLDAVKRLPARQLQRRKNMDDARVILRHAAEARDGSTMAQLHTRLFGSAMQSVNRDSVKSDLHFVQGQLSMLLEKRT
jgi:hypothetical protein